MQISEELLKKALIQGNYLTEEDFQKAEAYSKDHHLPLTEYFLQEALLNKALLGQAISEALGYPFADLQSKPPLRSVVLELGEDISRSHRAILISKSPGEVSIATDTPDQSELLEKLRKLFPNSKISVYYALPEDIDTTLIIFQKTLDTRFSKIIAEKVHIAPEFLEEIFQDASIYRASDIHFEPQGKEILVRFRIDGVLHLAGRIPREFYENIVNRIKLQSRIRIDEHFAALDGSLRHEHDGKVLDLRTSIVPTVEGEKIVLRVLSSYVQGFTLSDLGLSPEREKLLQQIAQKPFGMILTTGPTGAGKTTTLYALLKLLNSSDINITTIEDPVEYKMPGVNQIQVNSTTNLSFAHGLRSIVRQDPDIILVGEIRDRETSEISVNAALTGHLLLSTFHSNDAATTIPRLLNMGIEPFLLASTLQVVIGQRLLRKICQHCRYSVSVDLATAASKYHQILKPHFSGDTVTLYQAKGCDACGGTGYKGRTAVFEFIEVTPEMQDLIMKSPSTREIWNLAKSQGSKSMFEDGITKIKSGITTIEEVLRVVEPT